VGFAAEADPFAAPPPCCSAILLHPHDGSVEMVSWPDREIRRCVWQLDDVGLLGARSADITNKPALDSRFALLKVTTIDPSFLNESQTGPKFYRCPVPLRRQVRFSSLPTSSRCGKPAAGTPRQRASPGPFRLCRGISLL
jgi:hypothetical protein